VQDPTGAEIAEAAALEDATERVTALLALLDVAAGDPLVAAVVAEEQRLPRP
jgi:fructuronate reductase